MESLVPIMVPNLALRVAQMALLLSGPKNEEKMEHNRSLTLLMKPKYTPTRVFDVPNKMIITYNPYNSIRQGNKKEREIPDLTKKELSFSMKKYLASQKPKNVKAAKILKFFRWNN